MKKMVSRWSWLMALVLVVSLGGNVWAQSKPEPASIAFNFKLADLMKSEFGQSLPLDQVTGGSDGAVAESFLKAQSIRGVVTLPEEAGAFMMMQGDKVPVDAYVEFAYDDSSDSKEAIETIADELESQSVVREEGDLRYFSPRGQETNIAIIIGIPGKVVFLTDTYKHDAANFDNTTQSIKDAMKKAGAAPAGIFLDFDQARPLIKSAIKMAKPSAPPAAAGFFEIPSQISFLQLVGDPGKQPALTLTAISPDEDQAEMLRETLQGLVGMGKMAMQQAPPDDPGAKVANGILGQLKPVREGKVVTLSLSKIEGLEDILP